VNFTELLSATDLTTLVGASFAVALVGNGRSTFSTGILAGLA